MLKQISIYTENRKGVLHNITGILRQNQINIDAMLVNDSAEFGTARFVVDRPDDAARALREAGYIIKITNVVGVVMSDEYGTLDTLLGHVLDANINLDYIYATYDRATAAPVAILNCGQEADMLENILSGLGYTLR